MSVTVSGSLMHFKFVWTPCNVVHNPDNDRGSG